MKGLEPSLPCENSNLNLRIVLFPRFPSFQPIDFTWIDFSVAFPYSLSFATNFATSATISATVCHNLPQRQKAPRSTDPRRTNHKKNFGVLQTFGDWITNRVRVWVHSRSSLSASSRRAWISSSESKRSSGMSRIHSWIRAMAPRQCCRSNAKRPRHRGGYLVAFEPLRRPPGTPPRAGGVPVVFWGPPRPPPAPPTRPLTLCLLIAATPTGAPPSRTSARSAP